MSQVTHKVVWGDTLSALAVKYKTTVSSIAKLNDIKNVDRIYVGQVLVIKNKSVSGGSSSGSSSSSSTKVKITAFGLQSDTDNLIFAIWSWSKSNTEHYEVEWSYYTDNGKWFSGNKSTSDIKESTYSAPSNAIKVRCRVKPISKKYKNSKDKEVSYWTGSWCSYKYYTMSDNPPGVPPVPTVELDQYTMKIRNENLDINAKEVEYQIVQNDSKVFKTGRATIKTSTASYSLKLTPGYVYKVRARGKRGSIYGDWSDYTSNQTAPPGSVSEIETLEAVTDTIVKLTWNKASGAETYSIQHAEKESYFEGSNGVTTIDNIDTLVYSITGLTAGKRYYFRIRAANKAGTSAWSKVKTIAIGEKPEPPTTWSDRTVATIGDKVLLGWTHNTMDGSKQMESQIEFEVNGVIDIHTIGMDINQDPINTFELPTFMFDDGTKVYWRVRTKGVTNEYSDWSVQRVIDMHTPPTLSTTIVDKDGNAVGIITEFPFSVGSSAGPSSQKPIVYTISIKARESYVSETPFGEVNVRAGDEIFSKVLVNPVDLNYEFHAGNIDLETDITYDVNCMVTMDTGLSVEETIDFTVNWEEVFSTPNAEILIDEGRLSTSIRPYCNRYEDIYKVVTLSNGIYIEGDTELPGGFQNGTSVDGVITNTDRQVYRDEQSRLFCIIDEGRVVEVSDVKLSVYRRTYDGKFVELATDIDGINNTFITDPHPALDYGRYRIVSTDNATGAISYSDITSEVIGETSIIIQWDENWSDFASDGASSEDTDYTSGSFLRLPYNVNISESNSPDVSVVNYIGREHPVSYYGTNLGVTSSWSTEIDRDDEETLHAIRRLSMYMGDVYVREPSGVGYWANVNLSYSKSHDSLTIPIDLNLTRVNGGI